MMVSDHVNYLTFEDPAAVNLVRRALKLAEAGDLYGAAETAGVDVAHAAVVSEGLRKGMRFSIGAEVDNDPRARPDAQNIVDAMRPDGMIRAVHFLSIEHPEKGADWQWPLDNPEFTAMFDHVGTPRVWELYMAALLEAIEKLPGQIVAHFYVPATFGHWPDHKTLEKYEDQFLSACAARGTAVEINSRFLYRDHPDDKKKKYLDAHRRLLKKAKAKGVGIAIASDAHSPKDQGNGFDQILKLLDEAGINELIFPVGGRLARVALRATKEHLERKAAVVETPLAGSSISGFSRAELVDRGQDTEIPEVEPVRKGRRAGPKERTAAPKRATKPPARPPKSSPKSNSPIKPTTKTRAKTDSKAAAKSPAMKKVAAGKKAAARKTLKKRSPATARKAATKKPAKTAKKPLARSARKRPASKKPIAKKKTAHKRTPAPKKARKPAPKKKLSRPAPKKRTVAKKTAKKKTAAKRRR